MRKRARVDANQPEIVKALRACGCSVLTLAQLGDGAPDLLVGYRGVNLLLEVKDGSRKPSERKLTPDEQDFHNNWVGHKAVVESVREAMLEVMQVNLPQRRRSKVVKKLYVVAVNRKEAVELALIIGHRKKSDANAHLAEVKAPPTDPHYANQYGVFCIPIAKDLPSANDSPEATREQAKES